MAYFSICEWWHNRRGYGPPGPCGARAAPHAARLTPQNTLGRCWGTVVVYRHLQRQLSIVTLFECRHAGLAWGLGNSQAAHTQCGGRSCSRRFATRRLATNCFPSRAPLAIGAGGQDGMGWDGMGWDGMGWDGMG
jgi:hypothetical protein